MNKLSSSYEDMALESKVMAATPVGLIQLLFEKCVEQVAVLRTAILANDFKSKHAAINKITSITQYLRDCLTTTEQSQSAVVVDSLNQFYQAIDVKLLQISLNPSDQALDELSYAFSNLASAWSEINVEH